MRSKRGGHPLHGTNLGTRDPTSEGSIRHRGRNSEDYPNLSHRKQTPYSGWRGRPRYCPFPDIGLRCDSTRHGTGQEPKYRIFSNKFYQQACGGSASRKGKKCYRWGINHRDSSHTIIFYLWWLWKIFRCIHGIQEDYVQHRNIGHALVCADISSFLHDPTMET